MSRNPNGSFDVICLNRTLETVNLKAIFDDSVCSKTVTEKPPSARALLICNGSSTWGYYLTRIPDGKRIGDSYPWEQCQQAIKDSSSGFTCNGSSTWGYYLTSISDGKRIGDSYPWEQCQQAVKAIIDRQKS